MSSFGRDPPARRSSWLNPRKGQVTEEDTLDFGSAGSVGGIAGSTTIGTALRSPQKQTVEQTHGTPTNSLHTPPTVTAVAVTPVTHVSSEGFSPTPLTITPPPRPTYTFYEDDNESFPWSVDPGTFISRPDTTTGNHEPPTATATATATPIRAVPVPPTTTNPAGTPGNTSFNLPDVSPVKHTRPSGRHKRVPTGHSLYSQEDMMWSENPEQDYFAYMLRVEQEQRARQGKPAEGSLLGDSTIEEMLQAGPLAMLGHETMDGNTSHYNPSMASTTMGGFSLATTEKSGGRPQQQQQQNQKCNRSVSHKSSMHLSTISSKSPWQRKYTSDDVNQEAQQKGVPLHEQGVQNFGKVLPDVIYVLDRNASQNCTTLKVKTSVVCGPTGTKKATCVKGDDACVKPGPTGPKQILLIAVAFVLCGLVLAGTAVAVYFAKFYDASYDGITGNNLSSGNNPTNQAALNQTPPSLDITDVNVVVSSSTTASPYPSPSPSELVPTTLSQVPTSEQTSPVLYLTEEPTTMEDEVSRGTDPPSWSPTDSPTKEVSSRPSQTPTAMLTTRPPSIAPSMVRTAPASDATTEPKPDDDGINSTPAFNNISECGCRDCVNKLDAMAGGVPCRDRIYFLVVRWGMEEALACRIVSGEEFPNECSAALCDPSQCVQVEDDEEEGDAAPPKPPQQTPTAAPALLTRRPSPPPTLTNKPLPTDRPTSPPQVKPLVSITYDPATAKPTHNPTRRPVYKPTFRPTTARPTKQPTISPMPTRTPTQRPTSLRLTLKGNDDDPRDVFPLRRCEGDCDQDTDCAEGLMCYQRRRRDPVPGCRNGGRESSATDFCVPEWATLPPTRRPTPHPTRRPTPRPTRQPVTWSPTKAWTWAPTWNPTSHPTFSPTGEPDDDEEEEDRGVKDVVTDFTCGLLSLFC